jgi:group I intron endonuclease
MGFIYKITNTVSKKCYIGETTEVNPEDRWKGHKQAISKGRGCPALGDAVKKYGLDKFTFQVLIICFDEDRYIYEKEYIKKYNSVVPNGYNILEGGAGGGFKGKTHSDETKKRLSIIHKKLSEDPIVKKEQTERTLKQMDEVKKAGVDWGNKVKSSEKYKKALEEGRVGGGGGNPVTDDVKLKISNSLKEYYSLIPGSKKTNVIIDKHRNSMADKVGVKVQQYTLDDVYITTYKSYAEAARESNVWKSTIQGCCNGSKKTAGGFKWKLEPKAV